VNVIVGTISVLTVVSVNFWGHCWDVPSSGDGVCFATSRVASWDGFSLVEAVDEIWAINNWGNCWNIPISCSSIGLATSRITCRDR